MEECPLFDYGTVASVDGDAYRAWCIFDGPLLGQMGSVPCEVLTRGARDAVRGDYPELPGRGTRVLVAFPRYDVRNAVILGAVGGNLTDASAFLPGVQGARSHAAWSGRWDYDAEGGQHATVLPDGTAILAGYTEPPALTRHVIDAQGMRQAVSFGQADRVASAPAPFELRIGHASGAAAAISAAGAVSAQAAAGQTVTLTANGATVTIAADGSVTIMPASGKTVAVSTGGGTEALARADHTHPDPQGGNTGPPNAGGLTTVLLAQ